MTSRQCLELLWSNDSFQRNIPSTVSFLEFDVTRRTRKGNFLKQIDQLIGWNSIEKAIAVHYAPVCDAAGRPAYSGLLLFKMLLVGIWNGGLSDESVENMANSKFPCDAVSGLVAGRRCTRHSVLPRFRTRLTAAKVWDGLLAEINRQIQAYNITVK
ncbi:MAG: transposase [Nitrosomonas sp.]